MSETAAKSKKRGIGVNKSRKSAWRRIDHEDIEDTAAFDVTQTLVKRLVEQPAPASRGKKRSREEATEAPVFQIDSKGAHAGLSRSIKKDVVKLGKGVAQLSEHHVRAIEKTASALPQRQKSLEKERKKRALTTAVFDVWGSSPAPAPLAPITKSPPKGRRAPKVPEPVRGPAVKLPDAGQSVNPDPEAHEAMILSAAAIEIDRDRQKMEFDRSIHPVTYALLDLLPRSLVQSLTAVQKQRVFAFHNGVAGDDDSRLQQTISFVKSEFGCVVDEDENSSLPSDEFLGLTVKNNLYVEDSESEAEKEEEEVDEDGVQRKAPRAKTRADRNRFGRHLERLKIAAREKKYKKFLNSVDNIKQYIADVEAHSDKLAARAQYREAMAEAVKEARMKGIVVRFRCGKHIFQEVPIEVLFPSDVSAAGGSLRKTKFSKVVGSAIHDRAQSVYRRGLLESIPTMTPNEFNRVKRQAHWKKKSTKFLVKF